MIRKIGVVGGGQLGRMLGLAGIPLGFHFRFWEPAPDAPAAAVGEIFQASYDDPAAADAFADGLDVVTYEFENVPAFTIERLQARVTCRPNSTALATSQDRKIEKTFFRDNGIETAPWKAVGTLEELQAGVEEFGPSILKTRTLGYDGKGQIRLNSVGDCDSAWETLGSHKLVLEKLVSFSRELSLVGVRGTDGTIRTWPLVENEHRGGILHKSVAPATGVSESLQEQAEAAMRATMEGLDHVGVLTIEFFEVDGRLMANEMAPRVHNSGHWTIEGAVTSQFENHIRAITGLPLGSCSLRFPSVMLNCIGSLPDTAIVGKYAGAHFHNYDKAARPGRKVGHITICDELRGSGSGDSAFEDMIREVESLVEQAKAATEHV